ncbi:MAG TPA: carboxypeptidase-like regulatory domain-containing protein [Terriglobales bacterium]|nr:carboxypeptidase-like regulatory domain-containing protein [Terriglobales bacterium]
MLRVSKYTLQFTVLLLATTLPNSLSSQTVGASISGVIQDPTGAALPAVQVVVTNTETGSQRILVSDDSGRYAAPSLAVGAYEVRATKPGFSPQIKNGIQLVVGQSATVDITLPVGKVQQELTVVEVIPPVNLSTQDSSGLVGQRQVKELPLNGRSYDQLLTLNPATVNYTSERSGGIGTSNSAVGNMFAVSGHRPQENLFLLNGIEFTGASLVNLTPGGASGQLLGVDAVREFNVVADTYGAEYGKRPGAQVSILTAAGTNQLHGSAYEFLRNHALDARNYFDQGGTSQFQRNVFGGALGGPIRKNKLFLFGNYEGFRQHLGLTDVTLVPDNDARAGYLTNSNGRQTHVGVAPAVVPLLSLWPIQNGPELGGGIAEAFSHPLQVIREDFGTARLDYTISDRDALFGVYTIDDSGDDTPTVNPLSRVIENLREQVVSLQEQRIFSQSVLNAARIGFSRAGYFFNGDTPVSVPGWVSGSPIGALVVGGGTASNGASQLGPAGTNAGDNMRTTRNLFTYDDRVTLTHGAHQIEAGAWFQQLQANDDLAQFQYGQASFTSLASFLQGTVSTFTVVPSPTPLNWRSLEAAGFFDDTLKLKPNLQLRAGFRFESTNGWNEAHGRASNYLFDSNSVIQTQPRVGSSIFTNNRAKFLPEPRIGVAWSPLGSTKTVVHAGFGIYRALLDNLDYRLDQVAPFNTTQTLRNLPVSSLQINPGATLPAGSLISPSGIQPDAYTPTILSYTLKVEREIFPNTAVSVGYVGSHGYHEILSGDANEPVPTVCPAASCPASLAPGTIYYPKGAPFANPNFANTTTWLTEGVSSYNALEVDVHRGFSHGLQLRGTYTFAKSLDDGTAWASSVGANAPGYVMFPANPKLDWGPSATDVRHLAAINGTYKLPLGRGMTFFRAGEGWRDKVASGWSLSGIGSLQSGFPFTPQLGFNPTNNGDSRNPIRPSWNPAFSGPVLLGNPKQYFNANAFVVPIAGTYGNVKRNSLTGPGLAELDVALLKTTALFEKTSLQFRAEFFNVLNHTNFATPNTVVYSSASLAPSPTAGVITATATSSRQIQFGLKMLF